MSPGAERTVAELAAGVPVRGARGLPRELSGLSAGRSRLWERAAGLGGEAERCGREEVAPVAGARPDRIHAPVDGTGVPMRGDAPGGRAGKGEDGRAGESVTRLAATAAAAAPEHGMSASGARLQRGAWRMARAGS